MSKPRHRPPVPHTYTLMDELMASDTKPLPDASRMHQLTTMWEGLRFLEIAPEPSTNDWRVCSDAVNLMETLVLEMRLCEDNSGLLMDAVTALALAGKRHRAGGPIRLSGEGIQAVRAVLEDYAQLLQVLPHRTVVRCHRLTERRIREIFAGRAKAWDVEVISI